MKRILVFLLAILVSILNLPAAQAEGYVTREACIASGETPSHVFYRAGSRLNLNTEFGEAFVLVNNLNSAEYPRRIKPGCYQVPVAMQLEELPAQSSPAEAIGRGQITGSNPTLNMNAPAGSVSVVRYSSQPEAVDYTLIPEEWARQCNPCDRFAGNPMIPTFSWGDEIFALGTWENEVTPPEDFMKVEYSVPFMFILKDNAKTGEQVLAYNQELIKKEVLVFAKKAFVKGLLVFPYLAGLALIFILARAFYKALGLRVRRRQIVQEIFLGSCLTFPAWVRQNLANTLSSVKVFCRGNWIAFGDYSRNGLAYLLERLAALLRRWYGRNAVSEVQTQRPVVPESPVVPAPKEPSPDATVCPTEVVLVEGITDSGSDNPNEALLVLAQTMYSLSDRAKQKLAHLLEQQEAAARSAAGKAA